MQRLFRPFFSAQAVPAPYLPWLRQACAWLLAACAVFVGMPASHAAYPERAIQVVISFPPAGATDVLARAVGQRLSAILGQAVVVENRPGAGGAIGLTAAARAKPDGYTLYLSATTNQAIAAAIYRNQAAHLVDDFLPIGLVGLAPHALVVPATLPVDSAKGLVDYLKAGPGKYNYASQGTGTLSHLESALFVERNGLEVAHIPYRGSALALPDVVSGTATMMFDSIAGSRPLVQAGKLKMLAVASSTRIKLFPDVPTLAEAGIENIAADNLFGLFAPKGTPEAVIATLSTALRTALDDPELQALLENQGGGARFSDPAELGRVIREEHAYWADIVKSAGIQPQ